MAALFHDEQFGVGDQAMHLLGDPQGCEMILLTGDDQGGNRYFGQDILSGMLLRRFQQLGKEDGVDVQYVRDIALHVSFVDHVRIHDLK